MLTGLICIRLQMEACDEDSSMEAALFLFIALVDTLSLNDDALFYLFSINYDLYPLLVSHGVLFTA